MSTLTDTSKLDKPHSCNKIDDYMLGICKLQAKYNLPDIKSLTAKFDECKKDNSKLENLIFNAEYINLVALAGQPKLKYAT